MEVTGFGDAGAGEPNQAKPNQPGFAAAHHRTAREGHSFLVRWKKLTNLRQASFETVYFAPPSHPAKRRQVE
jgi:hypothetical protein